MRNANLEGVDLSDTDLSWAYLYGAKLTGANLTGADLRSAMYDNATEWPEGFDPVAAGAVRQADD
jgi:uncharacterized protein YjbI with pentapeptide repeats